MARPRSEYPTGLELQILQILWAESPLPVRDIRLALAGQERDIAHTSVITTLNTMVDKRYLKRTKQGKAFLFSPRVSEDEVSQGMMSDVVNRVFGGSATAAVLSLFDSSQLDADELQELRRQINRKAREQSKD